MGDVDGAEIPTIYFDFLQTGQVDELVNVIRHNEWDMYAMPAIMGWLASKFVSPAEDVHPADLVGLAMAERYGDERALEIFTAVSERTSPGRVLRKPIWLWPRTHMRIPTMQKRYAYSRMFWCSTTAAFGNAHAIDWRLLKSTNSRITSALTYAGSALQRKGIMRRNVAVDELSKN